MKAVAVVSLGLRFCLELVAYASLAYWGASGTGPLAVRTAVAVGAPLVAVVLWSRWLAPRAPRRLHGTLAVATELAVFSTAAVALAGAGLAPVAVAFALVAAADVALVRLPAATDAMATVSGAVPA